MQYFDRTRKCANILLASGVVLMIIAIVVLFKTSVIDQVFEFSNGNFVRDGILFTIYFLLSLFMLIVSIALKCIVKDAKEELDSISRKQEQMRK